jgi:hypothetical protein
MAESQIRVCRPELQGRSPNECPAKMLRTAQPMLASVTVSTGQHNKCRRNPMVKEKFRDQ